MLQLDSFAVCHLLGRSRARDWTKHMTADDFRQLFDYHFAANRRLWDFSVASLTAEQFKQKATYSVGSVRNQLVHLMNMDQRWFCALRGEKVPGLLNPVYYSNRDKLRQYWDVVEAEMREYLQSLQDADLNQTLDDGTRIWQALFHVLNHGTDHRAQTLAILDQLGVPTWPQDFVFFLKGKF